MYSRFADSSMQEIYECLENELMWIVSVWVCVLQISNVQFSLLQEDHSSQMP